MLFTTKIFSIWYVYTSHHQTYHEPHQWLISRDSEGVGGGAQSKFT